MATARQRSGKTRTTKATDDAPTIARVALPDGAVDVEINAATFTFRERHEAAAALGRLVMRDDDGHVIAAPDRLDQWLVYAWIVLRRDRPDLTFDTLFDLPVGSLTMGDATPDQNAPRPGEPSPEV